MTFSVENGRDRSPYDDDDDDDADDGDCHDDGEGLLRSGKLDTLYCVHFVRCQWMFKCDM